MDDSSKITATRTQSSGCINPLIALLTAAWIVTVSYGKVGIEYLATSTLMAFPNYTWGSLGLGQFALLAPPLLLLSWLWKNPAYRAIFRSWLVALGSLLLSLPAYFLPQDAANGRALYQTASALLLTVIIRYTFLSGRAIKVKPDFFQATRMMLPSALLISGLFTMPWIIWGAPGSLLEMSLQFVSALSLGMLASQLYALMILPHASNPDAQAAAAGYSYLRTGFSASVTLLLLSSSTTFSFGAMQILLMVCLPVLGWVIPGIGGYASQTDEQRQVSVSQVSLSPAAILIGLCAAAPMIWFDPDELALIISASPGEVIYWAGYASAVSLVVGLIAAISFRILAQLRSDRLQRAALLMAISTWLIVSAIFFIKIRQGFHGDGLFAVLATQADLSTTSAILDPQERRAAVYQQLVAHALDSQSSLRARLDRWGIEYQPYYLVNAIQVNGGPLLRLWLEQQPEIDRVLDNPWMRPLWRTIPVTEGEATAPDQVPWNISQIQADRVWKEFGVRGEGIIIGNSDSGMQMDHPEFQDSYRGVDGSHDYNWFDPWYHSRQPTDTGGHGTHTLGIILGNHTGVAPDAQWIGCVNLARNLGNPSLYLDCLQFMLAPFPLDGDPWRDGRPELGAQVLNNSWGCPAIEGCDEQSFAPAVQALRAAGIFVVASAGNDGPWCGSLSTPPAIYDTALAVGAVDASGALAFFSSIGTEPGTSVWGAKPDLVAPGVEVLSAFPNGTYSVQSGTSMAGPHVAGVIALLWSANPDLIGDIEQTEQILLTNTRPYRGPLPDCPGVSAVPSTAVGYGIVDAYQAVQAALKGK